MINELWFLFPYGKKSVPFHLHSDQYDIPFCDVSGLWNKFLVGLICRRFLYVMLSSPLGLCNANGNHHTTYFYSICCLLMSKILDLNVVQFSVYKQLFCPLLKNIKKNIYNSTFIRMFHILF